MNLNIFPISASRLRNRTVKHGGRRIRGVSLFPFFDGGGRVRRIMAATRESSEIYVLPDGQPLPRLPLYGRIRMPAGGPFLDSIRSADLNELENLWHYDPWWVLDEERFAGHWARKALKGTNCVSGSGEGLVAIYYHRDLSQAAWIVYKDDSGCFSVSGWDERRLPKRVRRRQSHGSVAHQKAVSRWILDPIWTRK